MIEDKERWNVRHVEKPMKHTVSPIVENYVKHSKIGNALDLACGTGRNSHFLEELGFSVDAVDLSDYALSRIKDIPSIKKIEVDLDSYDLEKDSYDLCMNLLDNAKVGLIPGRAFGPSGAPFIRLCFARKPEVIQKGVGRMVEFLENHRV